MRKIKLNQIILLFLLLFNFIYCDWASPCERVQNPTSYDDCKGKSTEFVYEACCYLRGVNSEFIAGAECVDIERDHIRFDKDLNQTKQLILHGMYWDKYNLSYKTIEEFRCFNCYIYSSQVILLLLIILLII